MKLFYSPDYVLSTFAFDTTRKAQWIVDSLQSAPIDGIAVGAPEPVTASQLNAVHDPRYVSAIRSGMPRRLAETTELRWEPRMWPMVLASTGGVVAAARCAMREGVAGSLSSGLHHARYACGKGFCTFNGLALAACAALAAGVRSVLVLDLDAHCGGGTHTLLSAEPRIWHADIATDLFDSYQPQGRHTLELITSASDYLPTLQSRLTKLERSAPAFDLCLYNAGMDPFEGCDVGGLKGISHKLLAQRERIVFEWCERRGIPIAFMPAGGYVGLQLSVSELVALHRLTLETAAAMTPRFTRSQTA